jgi:alkaline phosphatase D
MDRRRLFKATAAGLAGYCLLPPRFGAALAQSAELPPAGPSEQPLTRFAFGSCNRSTRDQSHWGVIARKAPQLWIWLGDNIYGDGLSMSERRQRYAALRDDRYYAAFRERVPVIGVWDDHDYASDNQDGSFRDKAESKAQLMEFLDIAPETGILDHSGVYQSYSYGPPGQRTKVVLLDLRYNQDRHRTSRVLLGEDQWSWLAGELAVGDFELLLVGSSVSVSSQAVGFGLEGWHAFPAEYRRLQELLASVACPTLILSGDRHQADVARFDPGHGRYVYEFMSSGLTHAQALAIPNAARISKVVGERNYGLVDIAWEGASPSVRMQIRSPVGDLVLDEVVMR